ncbi:hypothetical protein LC653_45460 [Nostoc sp. CHAB 5784]|uniref:hypothetical protein n=1 Tax=Nostoc mirabile TaxID=2907820 RepID=UPI001E5DF690|nr:hypothetical protein [Nostoc mirabile]MCC5670813.1 hypothetical protein [Nostoc mirabile CHAB5784]
MLKKFLLSITTAILVGSFVLAVHDKDFRDDYVRLAVPALRTLVDLSKTDKKQKK